MNISSQNMFFLCETTKSKKIYDDGEINHVLTVFLYQAMDRIENPHRHCRDFLRSFEDVFFGDLFSQQ